MSACRDCGMRLEEWKAAEGIGRNCSAGSTNGHHFVDEVEAEERRLSDIVVEAAMADSAYRESFQKNKDIDKMLDLSDSLRDACARLSAFRKEKGTR